MTTSMPRIKYITMNTSQKSSSSNVSRLQMFFSEFYTKLHDHHSDLIGEQFKTMNFHKLNHQTPNTNNHGRNTTVGNSFEFCAEFPQSRASSARKHDFAMIPLFYGGRSLLEMPLELSIPPRQLLTLDYFQNSQSYAKTRVVILTLPSPFLNKRIEMLSCMDGLGLPVV